MCLVSLNEISVTSGFTVLTYNKQAFPNYNTDMLHVMSVASTYIRNVSGFAFLALDKKKVRTQQQIRSALLVAESLIIFKHLSVPVFSQPHSEKQLIRAHLMKAFDGICSFIGKSVTAKCSK